MGKNVKREALKAFRKLGPMFYVEALGELESLRLFDIGKAGHACIKYAKKNGIKLTASNSYCHSMIKWLESCGFVQKRNGLYVPVENWQEKVKERFPTDNVEELLKKKTEIVDTATTESPSSTEEEKKPTYYNYYCSVLWGIGEDFVTPEKIRELVKSTYKDLFGQAPDFAFIYAREKFLKKGLVESLKDDDGSIKFLRATDWMEKLSGNKRILSVIEQPTAKPSKKEVIVEEVKEEKKPLPTPKKSEIPRINVWVDENDAGGFLCVEDKDILFRDSSGGKILVSIKLIEHNVDLLTKLDYVDVVKRHLPAVREIYKPRRELHVKEIKKIDLICQC